MDSKAANRRWLAPEVVQTSTMDCGPAALKSLLEGFHIPVSYGRLREACQTDVDGTSIDMIEEVANRLGVTAEQTMLPVDHVFLPEAGALPAMVVVRHPEGSHHFVVVWRRHGAWLQIMDPAAGRRWVKYRRFSEDMLRHEHRVSALEWRDWAGSDEFIQPLRHQLKRLGASTGRANAVLNTALQKHGWLALATLDASIRLITSVAEAGGVNRGAQTIELVLKIAEQTANHTDNFFTIIPPAYWSVRPEANDADGPMLLLRGAVLLRIKGRTLPSSATSPAAGQEATLSRELTAALKEKPQDPLRILFGLLKTDGVLSLWVLIGALTVAVGAVLVETLLFRGIFDIAAELSLADQRLTAVLALMIFVSVLMMIEIPIAAEGCRFGRHIEIRLRMALLQKLPHLPDRYFQSRPISDMAERSHSIYLTRLLPALGIQFIQTLWDILFTLAGIILIDPANSLPALTIALLATGIPLAAQPLLNESDLRVRSHAGALFTFYLDALLGLAPIRTHRAEQAVRREHEGLLVEWVRASRDLIRLSLGTEGVQSLICLSVVGFLLLQHFVRAGGVTGSDLLLIYWTLKLPALGHKLTALAHQYPMQRNILLRLLEPLSAPVETDDTESLLEPSCLENEIMPHDLPPKHKTANQPVGITIADGAVVAAGHTILQNVNLAIRPGEHVAIVGASGAGKSSLIGLLLGWHNLASGSIEIDGSVLTGTGRYRLRRATAWVDPAIQIWNRPFLDNLGYASVDSRFEKVGTIIEAADLRTVLQKLPSGLQTHLGESGALLSGGEGQRVRLGRALLQTDVRLALLDEPFRGMDRDQRRKLLAEVRQWWDHATMLCVTHDVSETLSFNRVLVIEDGQLVEDGPPDELARCPSRYRDLLNAEEQVRKNLWKSRQWRRLFIHDGSIKTACSDSLWEPRLNEYEH